MCKLIAVVPILGVRGMGHDRSKPATATHPGCRIGAVLSLQERATATVGHSPSELLSPTGAVSVVKDSVGNEREREVGHLSTPAEVDVLSPNDIRGKARQCLMDTAPKCQRCSP
jgi:hypothetical protein